MNIGKYVDGIRSGKTLLYPTDTIWGLGCDAFDTDAIKQVQHLKRRDPDKPLIVLVDTIDHIKRYVREIHPRVETLLSLHDRPLTVIYPSNGLLPSLLTSDKGTIAIRVVQNDFCKALIEQSGKAIVSTSANTQGHDFPKSFDEIEQRIKKEVDLIVTPDIADCQQITASAIITFDKEGELEFLRH